MSNTNVIFSDINELGPAQVMNVLAGIKYLDKSTTLLASGKWVDGNIIVISPTYNHWLPAWVIKCIIDHEHGHVVHGHLSGNNEASDFQREIEADAYSASINGKVKTFLALLILNLSMPILEPLRMKGNGKRVALKKVVAIILLLIVLPLSIYTNRRIFWLLK